jgi:ABC-type nitrate/sulfonate/bicarbonate transport system substrate-binding protein
MELRQSFFVQPPPYVVAEDQDLFAVAGLDVISTRTRSSGEQLAGLVDGGIDVAITSMDNVFVWNQSGADLRVVAQVESTILLTVFGRSGIESMSQLEGGQFAVDAAANGFALIARRLLNDAGVEASFVEVGGVKERLDALAAGDVDGTLLGSPFDQLAEREGLVALVSANAALPTLGGQGVVVRAQRSAEEQKALTTYLKVLNRAIVYTNHITDSEGIALFARNGFDGRAASDAWRTRPRSLTVNPESFNLLESLRAGFGLLPAGYGGAADIVDYSVAASVQG